jgi:hypothetical protein
MKANIGDYISTRFGTERVVATYDGQYELADGQVLNDIDVSIADMQEVIVYPPADHPPTIEQITVWKAHGDGGERGTGPVLGDYSTEYAAVADAKGRAWYDNDCRVENASALKIGDQIWFCWQARSQLTLMVLIRSAMQN